MTEISDVPGIGGSTLDLFKRAGVVSAEALAQRDVADILADLEAANRDYEIPVRLPSEASVRTWQNAAKSLLRRSGQVEVMPAATEVDGAALKAAGIDVNAMPVAEVVSESGPARATSERAEGTPPGKAALPPTPAPASAAPVAAPAARMPAAGELSAPGPASGAGVRAGNPEESAAPVVRRRIEAAARKVEAESAGPPRGTRFRPMAEVLRAAPSSERRNRGMSHPDAGRVRLAAFVTVLGMVSSTATALLLVGVLIMATFYGKHFEWTIALLLLVFPVSLAFYLAIGTRVRCRLCGQRLFVPRHCHKHEKARRSIFGHTFAVARDAALFGGYRCMLCGTKTRLRD